VRFLLSVFCMLGMPLIGCAHHNEIKDKVVVIIGASSGFGKGVPQKLAAPGAHVVLPRGARR
jgi:5,10-methylene-tetrahydrofolate dehydrogenase/methenyl tetrahydrofolate cyclohydrolase